MSTEPMKIWEYIEATQNFNSLHSAQIPYKVWAAMGQKGFPCVWGDQVQFTKEGNFLSLNEAREVIVWIANQLGGKVEWDNA